MKKLDKKTMLDIFCLPALFVTIMWVVKLIEIQFNISLSHLGVFPQKIFGIKGVLFSPFIHKDLNHLFNNSLPIIILSSLLFSIYRKIALNVFIWLFFISGFWLWIIGRPSFHIGASGMIYALAAFLFVSGLISKNPKLAATSCIIIFLYGSMIWGVLPIEETVSWEGHLSGLSAGVIVAFFFKNDSPKRDKYEWEIEEELEKLNQHKSGLEDTKNNVNFTFTIKKD